MSGGNQRRRSRRGAEPRSDAADLELLAVEERFVAEHRAGRQPRLSAYVAAYPQHAPALAAFVAQYLDEEAGVVGDEAAAAQLSAGTQRALGQVFPQMRAAGAWERRAGERRVAEAAEAYATGSGGLLALAVERGMTPQALADALDLTPSLVRWLDAAAFRPVAAPAALVARLARALEMSEETVLAALEVGGGPAEAAGGAEAFREALLADATLSQERRRRWLAALGDAE